MGVSNFKFIPVYLIPLIILWVLLWKGMALWRAANKKDKPWFIALLVVNSLGILPIFYLFVTRRTVSDVADYKDATQRKKSILQLLAGILLVGLLAFGVSIVAIGSSVKHACDRAVETYSLKNDCVAALHSYAIDEHNSDKTRITSIWAIGQLGEKGSKPYLELLADSTLCTKSDSAELCKYELAKAHKWVTTDKNILSPLWQMLFLY